MEIFDLKGKVAVVIGGSSGLGKGIGEGLANAGASVILGGRRQAELNKAVSEIQEKTKADVIGIPVDITSVEAIADFVGKAVTAKGHIDILVNSAGLNSRKSALDFTEKEWDNVMDVQLKYVFFMNQAVGKHMIQNNIKGKIINIASLTSVLGLKNMVAYCAAKGGIIQLTKALANEWAQYGINVNAIGPGYFETEMTKPLLSDKKVVEAMIDKIPLRRLGVPEDLIGAAILLASDASAYMTGQVIYVDGGWLIE